MQAFFDVCLPYETEEGILTESDANRLLCHMLIQHLDEHGLSEAREALADMVRFYDIPTAPLLPMPESRSIPVRVTDSSVRPVFPVTEED